MSDPENNQDLAMLDKHALEMAEHFDSVMVFATRHESGEKGGTVRVHTGYGNFFSRYGQVAEWMIRQDELTRLQIRKED